eukprot:14484156-Ditylum_brightwellii.AAC.1
MPPPWQVFLRRHSRERQLLRPSPGRASRCVTFGHESGVRNTAALSPHRSANPSANELMPSAQSSMCTLLFPTDIGALG